jgi:hypothetical protein
MKLRKIYYVPGMISLIFLPILCVLYLYEHKNEERCIDILYPLKYNGPHDLNNICSHRYDTSCLSESWSKRYYKKIILSGIYYEDSINLIHFENNIKQIINSEDTINGVLLVLNDRTHYSILTKALDVCKKDSLLQTNMLFDNKLWFHHSKSVVLFKKSLLNEYDIKIKNRNLYNKNNVGIAKIVFKNWNDYILLILLSIIYTLFSIISIRYITSNYRNKKQLDNNERFN